MEKLDKYIFLTICEITIKQFKQTNYSSFVGFCHGMSYSLKQKTLYNREKNIILDITKKLDLIYSMDANTTAYYIDFFFRLPPPVLETLVLCVIEGEKCFPNAYN